MSPTSSISIARPETLPCFYRDDSGSMPEENYVAMHFGLNKDVQKDLKDLLEWGKTCQSDVSIVGILLREKNEGPKGSVFLLCVRGGGVGLAELSAWSLSMVKHEESPILKQYRAVGLLPPERHSGYWVTIDRVRELGD